MKTFNAQHSTSNDEGSAARDSAPGR